MTNTQDPRVLVMGDQTIDWAVRPETRFDARSEDERLHIKTNLYWHPGGIFLLKSMINAALTYMKNPVADRGVIEEFTGPPDRNNDPLDSSFERKLVAYGSPYNHSIAVLNDYRTTEVERTRKRVRNTKNWDDKDVVRVDQYLGFRRHEKERPKPNTDLNSFTPQVIVIDDADLGFRERNEIWDNARYIPHRHQRCSDANGSPEECSDGPHPWVILKMSHEIAQGGLWRHLHKRLEDPRDWLRHRLIVVTGVARLRDKHAEVSRNLSWDRSARDIVNAINEFGPLRGLKDCPRLIVSFGPSGALLVRGGGKTDWTLAYNHLLMEGDWAAQNNNGMMFGYGGALCACLVRQLVRPSALASASPREPDLVPAILQGLVAMQRLYDDGFEIEGNKFALSDDAFRELEGEDDIYDRLSAAPESPVRTHCSHDSLLAEKLDRHPDYTDRRNPQLAIQVAREGIDAVEELRDVPAARFGRLVTVDQDEIEGLHAIYNLIESYCGGDRVSFGSKPLAIAVFGSPGSGKGFTINELISEWTSSKRSEPTRPKRPVIEQLSFNLSQLTSPSELVGAFHQVRDIALEGKVPLVLWDEFDTPLDSVELGWLRYYLAPIQDGKFAQREATHLIGPAIFAFAGGTSKTFGEFAQMVEGAGPETKAKDFLSRLRGYIDIADVNPPRADAGPDGPTMLRRAIALNGLFGKYDVALAPDDSGYAVDDGVLRAFLLVGEFKHGVRSMEAIIQMSRRPRGLPFNPSSLPSEAQLDLHVKGKEFCEKMRGKL